jgi:hypothetical protein
MIKNCVQRCCVETYFGYVFENITIDGASDTVEKEINISHASFTSSNGNRNETAYCDNRHKVNQPERIRRKLLPPIVLEF